MPALTELASPSDVLLTPEVRPVSGQRAALVVHSDALGGFSFARRIDENHLLGPTQILADRQPVTLLEGTHPWLVSARGQELCLERMDEESAPRCHRLRADVALTFGGLPLLMEQRMEPEDEDDGKRSPASAAPKPPEARIWLHRFDAAGNRDGEAIDTGLLVQMPLPGMGLVGAAQDERRLRVLHFQADKPKRDGRVWVPQAKLVSVLLDERGQVMKRTTRTVYEGDRSYGFVEGHQDSRLFGSRVVVGRSIDRSATPVKTGWEAYRLAPVRVVPAPNAVFGVDPWRLADPRAVGARELTALSAIYDAAPRLSVGQPASDAGRVAWIGERGFFLQDGKLTSASRPDGATRVEAEPFVAKRSRVAWATLLPDGSGLAATTQGLIEIATDGNTRRLTPTGAPAEPPAVLSVPARIGDGWWAVVERGTDVSGGAIVRLAPSPAEAPLLAPLAYADTTVLIGGATSGFVAAVHGGRLRVFALAADGSSTQLGESAAPFGGHISGVTRPGGGALLVGRDLSRGTAVSTAVDSTGKRLSTFELAVPGHERLAMVSTPTGAIVMDAARTFVTWLNEEGAPVARTRWAAGGPALPCVDGVAARAEIPSTTPGTMDELGALAGGHCWSVPLPVVLADGNHRWVGTLVNGLDSKAVLANLPAGPTRVAEPPSAPPLPLAANKKPKKASCPPDMVSIAGRYCIDRFEAQLVDRHDGAALSPDYPTTPGILKSIFQVYSAGRWTLGDLRAQSMPLPPLLRVATSQPVPAARSRHDVRPSGYLTWHAAQQACAGAGKRLCTENEWVTACRGEQKRSFPYGDDFALGKCNVWRFQHPAAALHGNASVGHLDPRLNRVLEGDDPLLRRTGTTPTCASRWGDDAVFDMVGNLDEWIEHDKGAFMGGFYSRTTKKGCDAKITAHPKVYLDYSLGTRCCRAVAP